MKTLLVALAVVFLTACSPGAKTKDYPILPEELRDCKFFRLTDDYGASITVARCPNSATTVRQSDKAATTTVIIDGKEYAPK